MDKFEYLNELSRVFEEYDPSNPETDFDYWYTLFDFEKIRSSLKGNAICELGCSTGAMTMKLLEVAQQLIVIDGSSSNLEIVKNKISKNFSQQISGKVSFIHKLWEEFEPGSEVTDVIFARGLEHADEPVKLLKRINSWMLPNTRLHIIVPNASSLHRRIGVAMGMLKDIHELNERDTKLGHKRVYDRGLLMTHLTSSNFKVIQWEGIYLKPLSNEQMKKWDKRLIEAFFELGKELPDYCAEIYVCAEKEV